MKDFIEAEVFKPQVQKNQPITEAGIQVIKEKIAALKAEQAIVNEDMKDAQTSQSSNEENMDSFYLMEKSKSILKKIGEYNTILANVNVVDVTNVKSDKVVFGSRVVIENLDTGETNEYQVLSEFETDPSKGIISYNSPMGRELIGLYVDDTFEVQMGHKGIQEFIINEIK